MLEKTGSSQEFLLTIREREEIAEIARFLNSEIVPSKLIFNNGQEALISESIYRLLRQIIQVMESGKAVSVLPPDYQVTTETAAKILKVSHAHLLQLLESGVISSVAVNSEIKIPLHDLKDYKIKRDEAREKLLDEIMEISQEAGFYE